MAAPSSRMLALLSLLQARRDWPGDLLADRLGVSPRTIRRDVDRLRELGYRVSSERGRDGGYRLEAGEELPPLLLDDEQAVALAVALQAVPALGVDLGEAAERALATVRRVMPARVRHRLDAVSFAVWPSGDSGASVPRRDKTGRIGTISPETITNRRDSGRADAAPVDRAVLLAVTEASERHERLRFDYAPPSASTGGDSIGGAGTAHRTTPDPASAPRHVEPHAVALHAGRWYLVAFDLDRDDWRVFRLDRMSPRMPTRAAFDPRAIPGGDPLEFLRRRFRGSTDGDWPCRGSATVAMPAAELVPYLGAAAVEVIDDGRCRVRVEAWSWVGAASRLAGFDAPVSDLQPRELADAAAVVAGRLRDGAAGVPATR